MESIQLSINQLINQLISWLVVAGLHCNRLRSYKITACTVSTKAQGQRCGGAPAKAAVGAGGEAEAAHLALPPLLPPEHRLRRLHRLWHRLLQDLPAAADEDVGWQCVDLQNCSCLGSACSWYAGRDRLAEVTKVLRLVECFDSSSTAQKHAHPKP